MTDGERRLEGALQIEQYGKALIVTGVALTQEFRKVLNSPEPLDHLDHRIIRALQDHLQAGLNFDRAIRKAMRQES